eukprot:m.220764 g.220764  ORF g.220764 m.220764 type:complete len:139 (-) comp33329_c0_seq1:56-472(-)
MRRPTNTATSAINPATAPTTTGVDPVPSAYSGTASFDEDLKATPPDPSGSCRTFLTVVEVKVVSSSVATATCNKAMATATRRIVLTIVHKVVYCCCRDRKCAWCCWLKKKCQKNNIKFRDVILLLINLDTEQTQNYNS